jgi:uncharacterized protein
MQLTCEWIDSLKTVTPESWNRLVGEHSPFLEWEWLRTLEISGCVSPSEGWQPCHLLVKRGNALVAAAPMYLKGHSYGEFVFDQAWADAAMRMGLRYYPKLLGATPLTPATGYRFLFAEDEDPEQLMGLMMKAIDDFARKNKLVCTSFLYVTPEAREAFQNQDCLERITHNYQWSNEEYKIFDDFLERFNANQRRNIRRERAALEKENIHFRTYRDTEIPNGMYDFMYDLYDSTCRKFYWSSKYLNRQFFQLISECFKDRTVFIAGQREDEILSLSFNIRKGEKMYGRYWGCVEEVKFLHFSTCYYEPVDTAIRLGIQRFDPGAGGSFKMRRGFAATPNYSFHRIYQPRFAQILDDHLKLANRAEYERMDALNQDLPFKETPEIALEV